MSGKFEDLMIRHALHLYKFTVNSQYLKALDPSHIPKL